MPPVRETGAVTNQMSQAPAVLGAGVFTLVVARLAWMSDDAAITARVIANVLHDYGPNFNITERAQAFTHPLWFVLNTAVARIDGDIVFTMILISLVCSAGAAYLVLHGRHWLVVFTLTLAMSSTYTLTEFGASGLENPLSWLLMAAMWWSAREGRQLLVAAAAGLLVLNRLDLALVAVPFVLFWITRRPVSRPTVVAMGALLVGPPGLWAMFGWLYYGSPLPETAYSKLNTAIPQRELFAQGLRYALDLSLNDAVAVVVIAAALGAVIMVRTTFPSAVLALCGVLFYGTYVVWIGGDFMSGRFWTVSVFAALPALADALEGVLQYEAEGVSGQAWAAGIALTSVLLIPALAPPVGLPAFRDPVAPEPRGNLNIGAGAGIVDEWTFYIHLGRGMVQWAVQEPYENSITLLRESLETWNEADVVDRIDVRCGSVGFDAIDAGPNVHFVVSCGLSDPFLSRIEFEGEQRRWRIGHFDREIPPGYFEALATGSPQPLPAEHRQLFVTQSLARRVPARWGTDVTWP